MIEALGGYLIAALIVISTLLAMIFVVAFVLITVEWGTKFEKDPNGTGGLVLLIFILSVVASILMGIRGIIYLTRGAMVSKKIHARMTFNVIHSSVSNFLERVPFGRLLNRFSADIDDIDRSVFFLLGYAILLFFLVIVDIVAVFIATRSFLLMIPSFFFIAVGFWYFVQYMRALREFKRLNAITKSPISGWAEATIKGLAVLRLTKREDYCMNKMNNLIQENTKNALVEKAISAWLFIRLSL